MARTFGEAVRARREQQDLQQRDLADLAGLSRAFTSDMERGRRTPGLATIPRIARALHVPDEYLLFFLRRLPDPPEGDYSEETILAAYRAFAAILERDRIAAAMHAWATTPATKDAR